MSKTILIVEDEPKNMKLLRDLLQRFGYEILRGIRLVRRELNQPAKFRILS